MHAQKQRGVGHGAGDHQIHRLRGLAQHPCHEVDGVFVQGALVHGAEVHAVQPGLAVHLFRDPQRAAQGLVHPPHHRHAVDVQVAEHLQHVGAGLGGGLVAGAGHHAQHLAVRVRQGQQHRQHVVVAGVAVEQDVFLHM